MFRSLFRKPLELAIGDQTLVFDSADDFEFALSGRADVPGTHVGLLMTMDSEQLRAETTAIHDEEQHLTRYFGDALSDPEVLEQRFQAFQSDRVRIDHDWQDILRGLAAAPQSYGELKRTAIVRYLQYLSTRARFIDEILDNRPDAAPAPTMAADVSTTPPHQLRGIEPELRARMRALPNGVRTQVLSSDASRVSLMLATNPVSIYRAPQLTLDYDETQSWPLAAGRTVVGRGDGCDVVLHKLLKDISRRHVVVEVDADGAVWITDTSSHGTYLIEDERDGAA